MPLVVGVTFRRVGKVYYFDPGELQLHEGDFVIAETARGVEFGEVMIEPRSVPEEELVAPLKKVVRVATGDDLDREASNRGREKHAYEVCERKIAEHNLPMKLLEAEYAFDGSQVTFSFSADGRVDFRELVKDVAGALKTKVQLHQIGVRDEAKLIGGYGTCGRALCCATFLSSFEPISMKMAKDQSLFLNPAKFSGVCGKLMCCLRYEHDLYKQAQKRLPSVGAIIPYREGRAKVIDVNVVSNMITVQTEDDVQVHIHASQINLSGLCRRHGIACNMSEPHCAALYPDKELDSVPEPEEEPIEEDADVGAVFDKAETGGVTGGMTSGMTGGGAGRGGPAQVSRWRAPEQDRQPSPDEGPEDDGGTRRKSEPAAKGDRPRRRGRNGSKSSGRPNGQQNRGRQQGAGPGQGKRRNGNHSRRRDNGGRKPNAPGPEPKSE